MKKIHNIVISVMVSFINKLIIVCLAVLVCVMYFSPSMVYALTTQEEIENEYGPYYSNDLISRKILVNDNKSISKQNIDNYIHLNNIKESSNNNEREYSTISFGSNIGVYKVNDEYKLIDTTIRKMFSSFGGGSSYAYGNSTNTIKSFYPSDLNNPFKLNVNDTSLFIKLLNCELNGSIVQNGSELIYPLNNNCNLDVIVENNIIISDYIINSPLAQPFFSYEVSIENGYYIPNENGLIIYDNDGNYLFSYLSPYAYDQNGNRTNVNYTIEENIVTYSIDEEWFNSPDRAFPIVVDPYATVWAHYNFDISIACNYPNYTFSYEDLDSQYYTLRNEKNGYVYIGNQPDLGDSYFFYRPTDTCINEVKNKFIKRSTVTYNIKSKNISGESATLNVCKLNTQFNEKGSNYNNSSSLIGNVSDCSSYEIKQDTTSITFDTTEYVKDIVQNGKPNNGLFMFLDTQSSDYVTFYANEHQNYPGNNSDYVPGGKIEYYDLEDVGSDYDDLTVNLRPFVKYSFLDGICNFIALGFDGKAPYESDINVEVKDDEDSVVYTSSFYVNNDFYVYPNYQIQDSQILNQYNTKESNYQCKSLIDGLVKSKLYTLTISDNKGHTRESTFRLYEVGSFDLISSVASFYGVSTEQLIKDNNLTDELIIEGNLLFIGNPTRNIDKDYESIDLTEDNKKEIDASLTSRNKECEYGYEPINFNTGSFLYETSDIIMNSNDISVDFSRIYNSTATDRLTTLGYGFSHSFDSYILESNDKIQIYMCDGSILLFTQDGLDYINNIDDIHSLTYDTDHYVMYDNQNQIEYVYGINQKLAYIKYQNDKTINLTYTNSLLSKIELDNKVLNFTYTNSLLTRIDYGNSSFATYAYDDDLNLIKYVDAENNKYTYEYDTNHNMISLKLNDKTIINNEYDSFHRVTKQTDPYNNEILLTYFADYTEINDSLGNLKKVYFDSNKQTTKIEYNDGTIEEKTYNNKLITSETSKEGVNWQYEYDSNGNLTKQTRNDGYYIAYTFDANNNLTQKKDSEGVIDKYTYDSNNNMLSHTNPLGYDELYTYDINSNKLSYTDFEGHVTQYEYNANNDLIKVTYPNGQYFEYAYNTEGYLISIKENGVLIETHILNKLNQLIEIDYQDGTSEKFEYDALSNLITYHNRNGANTSYEYDIYGNKIKEISPKGYITLYKYDINQNLIETTLSNGLVSKYEYDDFNNLINFKENDRQQTYVYNDNSLKIEEHSFLYDAYFQYDSLGRIISSTKNNLNETYSYDILGHIKEYKDPYGIITNYEYDLAGNLIIETNPYIKTTYAYDKTNNLISKQEEAINDGIVKTYSYEYDEMGNLIKEIDPLGNIKTKEYTNNLLTKETDARLDATVYEYDLNKRISKKTFPNGGSISYEYDGEGNLIKETDALNNITEYAYDLENNMIQVDNPDGSSVVYDYDSLGNIVKETTSLGKETQRTYNQYGELETIVVNDVTKNSYEYDLAGNIAKESDNNLTTINTYDSYGNLVSSADALGFITSYEYDLFNRVIKEYINNKLIKTNEYTNNNLIRKETDYSNISTEYTYNGFNEVTEKTIDGNFETFSYDLLGNILEHKTISGSIIGYEYDENSNNTKLNIDGSIYLYEYDRMNNKTKETDPEGHETTYTYDLNGNLIQKGLGGRIYNYTYDSRNREFEYKINGELINKKEYDLDGRVIKEYDHYGNYIQNVYDAFDNLVKAIDKKGNYKEYVYDDYSNLLEQIDENGNHEYYTYNSLNQKITYKNSLGGVTNYIYSIFNEIEIENNPKGGIHSYVYDDYGRLVREKNEDGLVIDSYYDKYNNINRITYNDKNYRQYEYDINGNLIKEVDSNNHTIRNYYDNRNRIIKKVKDNGYKEEYEYDLNDKLIKEIKGDNVVEYSYDVFDNILSLKEMDHETTYLYDLNDNLIEKTNALGQTTSYLYDYNNNLLKTTYADGSSLTTEYDENNNVIKQIDPSDNIYEYVYDGANNLIQVKDPNGGLETYTYNSNGNIETYKNKLGNIALYDYDNCGNLLYVKSNILADKHLYDYEYNKANRLIIKKTNGSINEQYEYDVFGNVSLYKIGDNTISYEYDLEGNLIKSNDNVYSYNLENNMISARNNESASFFEYDIYGNMTKSKTDDDQVSYEYDEYNNLIKEIHSDGYIINNLYDELGNMIFTSNGAYDTTISYDDLNREVSRKTDKTASLMTSSRPRLMAPSPLLLETTSYDNMSNVLTKTSKYNGSTIYSETNIYNSLGSIVSSSINSNGNIINKTYTYNANDELITSTTNGDTTTYYNLPFSTLSSYSNSEGITNLTYNDNHALLSKTDSNGTTNYTYDSNGNRTGEVSNTKNLSYYYDSYNRLYKVVDNNTKYATTYKYDALNNLISKDYKSTIDSYNPYSIVNCPLDNTNDGVSTLKQEEEHYRYSHNPLSEYSSISSINDSDNVSYNFYAGSLIASGDTLYITNRLNSTVVTIENGSIETYDYTDFGEVDKEVNNFIGYTGSFTIDNDYIYLNARFYDPKSLVFINKDTVPITLIDQSSFNEYEYCRLNPLKYVDPSGHSILSSIKNTFNKVINTVKKVATTVVNTVVSVAKKVVNTVVSTVNKVVNYVTGSSGNKTTYNDYTDDRGYPSSYDKGGGGSQPTVYYEPVNSNPFPTYISPLDLDVAKQNSVVYLSETERITKKIQAFKEEREEYYRKNMMTAYDAISDIQNINFLSRNSNEFCKTYETFNDKVDNFNQAMDYYKNYYDEHFDYRRLEEDKDNKYGEEFNEYAWDLIASYDISQDDRQCAIWVCGRSEEVNGFKVGGNGVEKASVAIANHPDYFDEMYTKDNIEKNFSKIKRGTIISLDKGNQYGHVWFVEDSGYDEGGDYIIISEGNVDTKGSVRVSKKYLHYIDKKGKEHLFYYPYRNVIIANPK